MGNLHKIGEQLTNRLRPAVAGHSVSYVRDLVDASPLMVNIVVGSPPIDHMLMLETGLDVSEQERAFIITASDIATQFNYPQIGDVIIDHDQGGTQWRVLPMGTQYAWKWFGQTNISFLVKAKQDS